MASAIIAGVFVHTNERVGSIHLRRPILLPGSTFASISVPQCTPFAPGGYGRDGCDNAFSRLTPRPPLRGIVPLPIRARCGEGDGVLEGLGAKGPQPL